MHLKAKKDQEKAKKKMDQDKARYAANPLQVLKEAKKVKMKHEKLLQEVDISQDIVVSEVATEKIFPRTQKKVGSRTKLWSEDLYALMELPLLSTTSFLWCMNLLFGAKLWCSLNVLGNFLGRKERKSTTNFSNELVTKGFQGMNKEIFKQLLFVEEDQLILGVEQVFQIGLVKGEKRQLHSPTFLGLALESLSVSRAFLILKLEEDEAPIYLFVEKVAGSRQFKLHNKFKPLLGLLDDGFIVPDVAQLDCFQVAKLVSVYCLV